MKKAVVYERKSVLYIRTHSKTKDGFWTGEGMVFILDPRTVSPEEIGIAVKRALDSSRMGIPTPDWRDPPYKNELLYKAKVKSWSAFEKTAKALFIEFDGSIRVIPTKNGGDKAGYVDKEDEVRTLPGTVTPTELGETVKQALEDCE